MQKKKDFWIMKLDQWKVSIIRNVYQLGEIFQGLFSGTDEH